MADPRDLARVHDIEQRPRVAVLVDRWDEDWSAPRLGSPGGHGDVLIGPDDESACRACQRGRPAARELSAIRDARPRGAAGHHGSRCERVSELVAHDQLSQLHRPLALLVIVVAMLFGWRSGFVIQAFALVGFLVGLRVVVVAAPFVARLSTTSIRSCAAWHRHLSRSAPSSSLPRPSAAPIGAALKRRMGRGIVGGARHRRRRRIRLRARPVHGLADGRPIAAPCRCRAVAIEARQSAIVRALDSRLPSPVVLAAQLGRLIEATGLPDIFVGAPPPPADLPGRRPVAGTRRNAWSPRRRARTVSSRGHACGELRHRHGLRRERPPLRDQCPCRRRIGRGVDLVRRLARPLRGPGRAVSTRARHRAA